ncbi:MAG: hypothetical protein ACX939_06755 [Hyphococcus sp.]
MSNMGQERMRIGLPGVVGLLVGAAAIIWLFLTGQDIANATERSDLIAAIWRHVGHGTVLAPLLLLYLLWRVARTGFRLGEQPFMVASCWLACAAVLYLIATGPFVVWTYGVPMKVFDWFAIPSPIGKMPNLHTALENSHIIVAKTAPFLVAIDAVIVFFSRRRQG